VILVALFAACSKKTPPPPVAKVDAAPAQIDLSAKLVDTPSWYLHLDLRRMRSTEALTIWRHSLQSPFGAFVNRFVSVCGFGVDGIDEVVASGRGGYAALVARTAVPTDKAIACLRALNNAEDTTLDGRPALQWEHEEQVAVVVDGLVYHGERGLVRELIGARDAGVVGARLGVDDVAIFHGVQTGMVTGADVTIAATDQLMGTHAVIHTSDEFTARTLEQQIGAIPPGDVPPKRKLLLEKAVTRDNLVVKLDVVATTDLWDAAVTIASLVFKASSAYLRADKTTEARLAIARIVGRLRGLSDKEKLAGRKPRLLASTGPLPPTIPPAQRWRLPEPNMAWAPLFDLLPNPTFYQFEVVTRPDGLAASVIARGDLDGNGVASAFETTVAIDANGMAQASPTMKVVAPLE
jgi:hypothetical protein